MTVLGQTMTDNQRDQLRLASEYAQGGSDLIQSIICTKVDFYSCGFGLFVNNGKRTRTTGDRLGALAAKHDLRKVAEELIEDWSATDNAILQWCIKDGDLSYVTTLAPGRVNYERAAGVDKLEVEIDEATRKRLSAALLSKESTAAIRRYYPQKYIDAVRQGRNVVQLSNSDGEYWTVRTKARRFTGLIRPSMRSVFMDVLIRRLLIDGDAAIAYYTKRVIEHVKAGESASANAFNPRQLYPTKKDLDNLRILFRQIGQTLRLVTNHTVKVEYPHPDPDVFAPIKYEKVEERIKRWGRTPDVLMTGAGETAFAAGHLGVRRFSADGLRARNAVGGMFCEFMLHESMRQVIGAGSEATCGVRWDEQVLKDPKQVMDETNSAMDRGALDVQSYHERLGLDHSTIRGRKESEKGEQELWRPLFEPRQGMLSGGGGGDGESAPGRPGARDGDGSPDGMSEPKGGKPRPGRKGG